MQNEISQCWSCKSVLNTYELMPNEDGDKELCPFCCTDNHLVNIDNLPEDREDR